MDLAALVEYVRLQPGAVISSLGPDGAPQSAYLDMTATDIGELVFNAREGSRKIANIRSDPRVSVVVGGRDGTTVQCEGTADLPEAGDLDRCAEAYIKAFPQFQHSTAALGIVIVRIRLTWARFGDFRTQPPSMAHVGLSLSSWPRVE